MKVSVVLLLGVTLFGCIAATLPTIADTVETWEGLRFEGKILSGLPDVLSFDAEGVSVNIQRKSMLELSFDEGGQSARAVTTTGVQMHGTVLSSISKITIRTASGETEIPKERVQRISFPYSQEDRPFYKHTIELKDGRTFEGDLSITFPQTLSIDENGIIGNVFSEKIIILTLGEPTTIETEERIYRGTLISQMPDELELTMVFGSIRVRRDDAVRVFFQQTPQPEPQPTSTGPLNGRSILPLVLISILLVLVVGVLLLL